MPPLDDNFMACLGGLIAELDTYGVKVVEVTKRVSGRYVGLGSTPKYERPEMTYAPLLSCPPDDAITPLGMDLLTEAIISEPRRRVGEHLGHNQVSSTLGLMFETYLCDVANETTDRTYVVGATDIAEIMPKGSKSCDLVLIHGNEYLAIEVSLQRLHGDIAAGQSQLLRDRCARYHEEADQAEETLKYIGEVATRRGLPTPTVSSYLVVTDVGVPHSPAIAAELRKQRPTRDPRFVLNVEEFEMLVELGKIGWGIPGTLRAWQEEHFDIPVGKHLNRLAGISPREVPFTRMDVGRWINEAPRGRPAA